MDLQQIALIIVDPDIPLVTSDTQLPAYVDMAFRDALEVTLQLVNSNPCIEELFNVVDAVVVDQWHNGWVSVQWKVEDIPKKWINF